MKSSSLLLKSALVVAVSCLVGSVHGQTSFSLSWDFGLDGTGTPTQYSSGSPTAHIGTPIAYYTGYTGTNQFIDASSIGASNVSWDAGTTTNNVSENHVGPAGWSLDSATSVNTAADAWIFVGVGHTQINLPYYGQSFAQAGGTTYNVGGTNDSPVWGSGPGTASYLVFDLPTLENYSASSYSLSITSVNFQAGAHATSNYLGPSVMGMYLWDGSNLTLLGSYNEDFGVGTTYYTTSGTPFTLGANYWNTFDPVRFGYYDLISSGYTLTPGTDYQLLFFAGWDVGTTSNNPNSFVLNDMEIVFSSQKLRKGGSPSASLSGIGTPEPTAGILALFSLGLLAFRRRRR